MSTISEFSLSGSDHHESSSSRQHGSGSIMRGSPPSAINTDQLHYRLMHGHHHHHDGGPKSPPLTERWSPFPPASRAGTPRALTPQLYATEPIHFQNGQHSSAPLDLDCRPLHRIHCDTSVLSLVVSNKLIFAGTQSGDIKVFSLETYDFVAMMKGHEGSVLAMALSGDKSLLFSSAGDAIVNVWNAKNFEIMYTIYSTFDVGDLFCVAYSSSSEAVYFGAQNTSIQWYDLKSKDSLPKATVAQHPSRRSHRFFDSLGPGGKRTRVHDGTREGEAGCNVQESKLLAVDPKNIVQYAHFGYVYCMVLAKSMSRESEQVLISGGGDGAVKIWEIDQETCGLSDERSKTLNAGDSGVLTLAVQDQFLYCGLTDGEINIWDLDTLQLIRSVRGHEDDVLTMTIYNSLIFSGGASGFVRKWSKRFELVGRWKAHKGLILASAVTVIGQRAVYITGGNDDCVSLWDISHCERTAASSESSGSHYDELLATLRTLVSYRTVSSNLSYTEDCRRGASFLKMILRRFGAQSSLIPTSNNHNPIVYGRFEPPPSLNPPADRKTILFYGHYDVISADTNIDQWNTDPFDLTGMDSYLYGRGVSDNKGPILAAIYAAGELLQEGKLTGNIVFLIEGEEECGSRGFAEAVRNNKDMIGPVDWILLANSYWLDDETPCLTYGLRGVVHATVEVDSEKPDLHSGVDGSTDNHEPTIDLINLLAKLTRDDGRVAIPNFYGPVREVTPSEELEYAAITNEFAHRPHPSNIPAERLKKHLMSKWRYPSLTIHRINVSGPANATIIPRSASAAVSIRIVPDQSLIDTTKSLETFLRRQFERFGSKNKLGITIDHAAEWWLGDPENSAFRTLEEAVTKAWGKKPLYIREGGSIPGVRFLEREFGAAAAHLPCGQASDHAHLDNERLRVTNLYKSKEIFKQVFAELPKKQR